MIYSDGDLGTVDLIVDALYRGYKTPKGGVTDPLVQLVGVSRHGGFRYRGTASKPTLLVLTSNLTEPDWPDELDCTTGRFVYYGDNRHPGRQLHDTPRFGNRLLKTVFDLAHSGRRGEVPPIFIFTSESPGRAYRFRGLAVPGHHSVPATEDLVAIWKSSKFERFQNYKAIFTILDVAAIDRFWIDAMRSGNPSADGSPQAWRTWVETGHATAMEAPRTKLVRSKLEQLSEHEDDVALVQTIRHRFKDNPFAFEACAGELAKLLLGSVTKLELTRPWRDGGRDGTGTLLVGHGAASISVAFALEAKCYGRKNSVGVREVSRLISRIKHREFGLLITTSFVDTQAYEEVVDDGHPVIFMTERDIARALRDAGHTTIALIGKWLDGLASSGGGVTAADRSS